MNKVKFTEMKHGTKEDYLLLDKHEKIIVIEDDLVVSPYFLNYMNNCLNVYEKNTRFSFRRHCASCHFVLCVHLLCSI